MKRMIPPQVKRGDVVVVSAFRNKKIERVVVDVDARIMKVFVTTRELWENAKLTNSEPDSTGFPIGDLVKRVGTL